MAARLYNIGASTRAVDQAWAGLGCSSRSPHLLPRSRGGTSPAGVVAELNTMSARDLAADPPSPTLSGGASADPLEEAIARGREALRRLQRPDGAWEGETDLGP